MFVVIIILIRLNKQMGKKEKIFHTIISDYQDMIYRLCCSYVENGDIWKD